MEITLSHPPPLVSVAIVLFIFGVWAGPIGLFVLRKHLAHATGALLVLKAILIALTALTAPAAALMLLMIVRGTGEAMNVVWSLLRGSW